MNNYQFTARVATNVTDRDSAIESVTDRLTECVSGASVCDVNTINDDENGVPSRVVLNVETESCLSNSLSPGCDLHDKFEHVESVDQTVMT